MGYYDVMRQRVTLADERFALLVKSGLVAWDDVAVASNLLAESAEIPQGARVLVLEAGAGALAVWAAQRGAEVHCFDSSIVAARMARQTLVENGIEGVTVYDEVCPSSALANSFDVALMTIPKGRAYTRTLLGAAFNALKSGSRMYIAGPNAGGAKAIVKDAGEIFGRAATVRTKARNRVGLAVKLANAPGALPPMAACREFELEGLKLFSTPGIFSWDGLDDGTAMLLGTLDDELVAGKRVLDMGCGYGVIGQKTARMGASLVHLVDASWLAVDCTNAGIKANGLEQVCRSWASDLYSDFGDEQYDLIVSNPPFHVGHNVDTEAAHALFSGAKERLEKGGVLRVVANLFLPYERIMGEVFGRSRVSIVTQDTRYRVIQAAT